MRKYEECNSFREKLINLKHYSWIVCLPFKHIHVVLYVSIIFNKYDCKPQSVTEQIYKSSFFTTK